MEGVGQNNLGQDDFPRVHGRIGTTKYTKYTVNVGVWKEPLINADGH
jgi:hypothetical protein